MKYENFEAIDHTSFRQRLNIARSNGEFADICLRVDGSGKIFKAHQVVLAAASDILKIEDKFDIKGVSEEDLEDILIYIYVGRVQVPQARLQSFLNASKTLRVFDLQNLVHDVEGSEPAISIKEEEESMEFKIEINKDDTFDLNMLSSFGGNVDLPNQPKEAHMSRPPEKLAVKGHFKKTATVHKSYTKECEPEEDEEEKTDSPNKMSEVLPDCSYDPSDIQPESNVMRSDEKCRDLDNNDNSRKEADIAGKVKVKGLNKDYTIKKPFNCTFCEKAFTCASDFKRHERVHTGERPFSCGTCKEAFKQTSHLNEHKKIHTGEKPIFCSICLKDFYHKSDLKKHERIHTGERPFSCGTCKKAFNQSSCLKVHERVHTGEKPFSCPTCKKEFARQISMKNHQKIHTG